MLALLVLPALLASCFHKISASNTPISPADFQTKAGAGFATNYFKTLDFTKYKKQNIKDIKAKGFKNLRLRCRADLDNLNMNTFLNNLETVVDDCLKQDVVPIITWIHHKAEAFATEKHKAGYLDWWKKVAKKLKNKDYRLAFNLFTELGVDYCIQHNIDPCDEALAMDKDKYNTWTAEVVKVIRNTGGNNKNRILILGSPKKTGKWLRRIDESIYKNEKYLMAEWHQYASGPNKVKGSAKEWEGDGSVIGQKLVDASFQYAADWTKKTKILTYFGAWMPQDKKEGAINQDEAISFSKYFIKQLGKIPWSLNVLDVYYNTEESRWRTEIQDIEGASLNMSAILDEIVKVMPK